MQGEKSTKYFLGLERIKYQNKTFKVIKCSDNSITRCEKKILCKQMKFYKKLYPANPEIPAMLKSKGDFVQYSEIQKKELDEEFMIENFIAVLKSMVHNKAPGCVMAYQQSFTLSFGTKLKMSCGMQFCSYTKTGNCTGLPKEGL